jgi:type 1 fimbriae regulatory protein FimE
MSNQRPSGNILGTVERRMPPRRVRNGSVRTREYLTKAEVDKLIKAARTVGRYGSRDALMIEILYRHGLRVSELIDLRWDQVLFGRAALQVNRLKNGDPSIQPLEGKEIRALRQLRREDSDSPFVFMNERGQPFDRRAVHKIVARAGQLAGIPFPVHPHMLRHSTGHMLANQGIDTRTIQGYLGHKSIQHTVRYTALSESRFKSIAKLL